MTTVADLIAQLQACDPNATVRLQVGWSNDTATSTEEVKVTINPTNTKTVRLQAWLSDTRGELETVSDEDERESDGDLIEEEP